MDIAINLAEIVYILPDTVAVILFPKLCAIKGTKEKWEIARKTSYWLAGIMILVCGLAALLAKPVIGFLFGSAFLPSLFPVSYSHSLQIHPYPKLDI